MCLYVNIYSVDTRTQLQISMVPAPHYIHTSVAYEFTYVHILKKDFCKLSPYL